MFDDPEAEAARLQALEAFANFKFDPDRMRPSRIWFAWFPVRMRGGRWVWLRRVLRQSRNVWISPKLDWIGTHHNYRPLPKDMAELESRGDGLYVPVVQQESSPAGDGS